MVSLPLAYAVFERSEIDVVQSVFSRIVKEPWFSSGAVHREQFALYVLKMYKRGLVIPEALEALCRVAREKFCARRSPIDGFRFLVVEDDYGLAREASERLHDLGAEVVGPVPSVASSLHLVEHPNDLDGALLDINLDAEMVYPVAGVLPMKRVRFAVLTGYDQRVLPPAYRRTAVFEKPTDWGRPPRISLALAIGALLHTVEPVRPRLLRSLDPARRRQDRWEGNCE